MENSDYPSQRILLGPGPSNVSPRVLQAMARPLVGHLDPQFIDLMNSLQDRLRRVFQTENRLTLSVSGTGSAGMEASVFNFVEAGDPVLVCVHGVFGQRLAEEMRRAGASLHTVSAPFGQPLPLEEVREKAREVEPRVIAAVHAETSTGVLQPVPPLREIADEVGALLLLDTVTSLGGHPVAVDDWGIDICYSGTQKCLSCPPGLAPMTASARAEGRIDRRSEPCQSWYLDLDLVRNYWGGDRSYHHTAPISMNYALHEALGIVLEEGLESRWARHKRNHEALVAGIEAMGLGMQVTEGYRLWSLNAVIIPDQVDDARVRGKLLHDFNLEIGGGLGDLKGKVWRVGLMGESSRPQNLLYFLFALEKCLHAESFRCTPGAGVAAASEALA